MINDELISIIIPIYNVEDYLSACIESIMKQTYNNLEIILVDDGSPDSSPEICDRYEKIDNRIKVIHQKNKGLSGARNTGINVSKGKYLIFVDSDDTVESSMAEELYKCLKKYNCKMAACNRNYVFEDGTTICKTKDKINTVFEFDEAIKEMNKFYFFDMSAWAKIYDRELFAEIRFPQGKLSEDYFVMYKLIDLAQKVGYTSLPLYNYLQRTSSISRNKKINHDFIEAARNQMKYLDQKYPELKEMAHTAYASANLTVYDFYLKNGVKCPKDKMKEFKNEVKKNIQYVRNNKDISKAKRIQLELFIKSSILYKWTFIVYRKIRRV